MLSPKLALIFRLSLTAMGSRRGASPRQLSAIRFSIVTSDAGP
jgi:hypothetical protein